MTKEKKCPLLVTHTSMHCFMGCRQKYDYRYNKGIVPVGRADSLALGSAVHAGLEMWFKTGLADAAVDAAGAGDELTDEMRIKAQVLVRKYIEVYAVEPFSVIDIEHTFEEVPRHPTRRNRSKRVVFTGKVDGIIEKDGELWILEHKTASVADDTYFDAKDFDDQIALYAICISQELKRPVVGALYDVILKPRISMKEGESDEEYEARVLASKTGKVKRKVAETIEEFEKRVSDAVSEFNFSRRWIRFDQIDILRKKAAFWAASHDMVNGDIYQNTCACLGGYGACEYLPLCKVRGDVSLCGDAFTTRVVHDELEPNATE